MCFILCRGKHFRKEFLRLREIRSLIPSSTRVMALTATASSSTRQEVIEILGMNNPSVYAVSPHKSNVTYWVAERESVETCFGPVVEKLKVLRCTLPRMIIYCSEYEDCSTLYRFFKDSLCSEFTEPIGAPDHSRLRLVDMYTSLTNQSVKEDIVKNFSVSHSPLRVVICTVAYGMGVDCSNVQQIVHWGPPETIEAYIQESGRAGRDDKHACALLLVSKKDSLKKYLHPDMVMYCKNTTVCRRSLLLKNIDPIDFTKDCMGCMCCDVCARQCMCSSCVCFIFA